VCHSSHLLDNLHFEHFDKSVNHSAISVFVSLSQKITTSIIAHRPIRFASRFASRCVISSLSLGQKSHNPCGKQHFREIATPDWVWTLRRTRTRRYVLFVKWPTQSGVAISRKCCFPHGSQHASSHIDRFDSPVDMRYLFLYSLESWPEKSQHASSHIDRCDSPVDVRYLILYSLGQKNHNMHRRTSTDSIRLSMCDICFCILLARKVTTCISHIDRCDSPVDVRYLVLYSLGQKNHNMHHRTSTDAIRPSMCDICFCILLARKVTTCIIAHRPIRFARRCAISAFVFSWPENHENDRTSTDSSRVHFSRRQLVPFLCNLHFRQIAKSVNLNQWLTLLAICRKWRLYKKGTSCRLLVQLLSIGWKVTG